MYIKKTKEGVKFWKDKELSKEEAAQLYSNNIPKKALGGKMIPLASNIEVANGDTHQEDTNNDGLKGITLLDKSGKPRAEIEDKEVVIDGDKVASDRVMATPTTTVAEEIIKLGKLQGKYESMMKTTDDAKKGTATRMIQRTKARIDNLYNSQPKVQEQQNNTDYGNSNRIMAFGGDIGDTNYIRYDEDGNPITSDMEFNNTSSNQFKDVANTEKSMNFLDGSFTPSIQRNSPVTAIPQNKKANMDFSDASKIITNGARFVDNINNANLINNTPQFPKPRLQSPAKLDTTYNIEPNLNENRNAYTDFAKNVDANNTNSNVANAQKGAAYAERLKQNNVLYGQKANIETQLKNDSTLYNHQINGQNLAKLDQYDMNNYNRDLMIKGEKSANVANAVEDIGKMGTEANQKSLDNSRISHIMKLYDNNDAAANSLYSEYRKAAKGNDLDELKKQMSKRPNGKTTWNNDPLNQGNLITD